MKKNGLHPGVSYDRNYAAKPWKVQITVKRRVYIRKYFASYEDACSAAQATYAELSNTVREDINGHKEKPLPRQEAAA